MTLKKRPVKLLEALLCLRRNMIINGNCLEELDKLDENSVDAIVTDPPYELNFMGKGWDNAGVSFNKETWAKCMRVLKPGGYLLAFGGSRTYHRIACAIEDGGFEIRDCVMWLYGSGFPKSMNIGLAIDKKNGVESKVVGENPNFRESARIGYLNTNTFKQTDGMQYKKVPSTDEAKEWKGWGTALKPSYEPIIVARKPFKGSLVDNVIEYGVGGINIDECRVGNEERNNPEAGYIRRGRTDEEVFMGVDKNKPKGIEHKVLGRFPANTILTYDETDFDEVCGGFPYTKSTGGSGVASQINTFKNVRIGVNGTNTGAHLGGLGDSGSAARYFYCAKASKKDRDEGLDKFERNIHPTVKPTALMQYLVRLVAPKGATILDPFMGSGSTGKAVMYENKERDAGYKFIGIELSEEYCKIAKARIGGI